MITAQGIGSGLDVGSIVSQLVSAEGQAGFLRIGTREASIQSTLSSLGNLKSALSEFQSALDPLKDIEQFRSRTATSSNEAAFNATASSSAVPSSYEIDVINLAQSQKLASGAFTSEESMVGYGTLTFQFGGQSSNQFSIDIPEAPETPEDPEEPTPPATNTLEAIRDAINDADGNNGVSASIVNAEDGARLILTATKTGAENAITITAEGGDGGLEALAFGPDAVDPEVTELRAALDATITVDSFTRTSASNTINDVIDGVTLNLVGAGTGVSTLDVAFDPAKARDKVSEFVDSYNTLIDSFAEFSSFDAETNTASTLLGDTTLREVSSLLRREIGGGSVQGYGFYRTLATIGVTTETDGKLVLDSSTLDAALNEDFDSVGELFAADDGFATRIDAVLEPYTQFGGRIDTRTDGLEASIDLLNDQRDRLNARLASVEQRYLRQFSALDGIISQLTSTSNFLAQQLNSLPGSG